jgi:hypothetical protein
VRAVGAVGEFLAGFGSSGNWICRSGQGLGALGNGFVVPGGVWEGQTLIALSQVQRPGRSPKELLTRGISILSESSGSWESSGRGGGALGAGFVALGKVWEVWELDLSCLIRFWSSRRSGCLTNRVDRVGPPSAFLGRGSSTV